MLPGCGIWKSRLSSVVNGCVRLAVKRTLWDRWLLILDGRDMEMFIILCTFKNFLEINYEKKLALEKEQGNQITFLTHSSVIANA